MVYTRCSAAAWCSINSIELNSTCIIVETDKNRLYEAAVCKVKRNRRSVPKHFKLDCFKTDRVCTFNMPFQCMHAKPRSRPQCQVSHSVARHQLGASQQHYPSYFLSPFTMIVANQLYHPCKYRTIAEITTLN